MFMMSPMMFDAPGSENTKNHVFSMMLILCYPIWLSILLWLFGANYFGFSGSILTAVTSIVVFLGFSVFGYFGMFLNLHKGIANTGYSTADGQVYYDAKPVSGADSDSFNTLENKNRYSASYFAVDKQSFYYRGKVVEGVYIDGIQPISVANDIYWVNHSQVIYDDKILTGANPEKFGDFEGFSGWTYSVNNNRYLVFSYGAPLPAVDRETFTPLNDFIAKDKDHIFEKTTPILTEADAESFELFVESHDFGKDKNHVYYISTDKPFVINDADPASFEILERGYVKDKNSIYHIIQYQRIDKLTLVDVGSFETTQYDDVTKSEARDKNHYYNDGKIVGNR